MPLGNGRGSRACRETSLCPRGARCGPTGVTLSGELRGAIARVELARTIETEDMRPADWHSQPVQKDAWYVLERLAARLLVPETTQSRASRAGPDR